jgi:hypothetical protein
MKKNVWFFKGILGVMLVFTLVLAGCDNPTQIDGDVSINAIDAPVVAAKAVTAGVELSWLPVVGVEEYEIWRRSADEPDRLLDDRDNTDAGEDGKIYWGDTVGLNNPLKSGTSYTYTVYAKAASSAKNDSKVEVSVTTGELPAEGTALPKPANVTLSLDLEKNQISVSWDWGDPSLGYWVDIYLNGSSILTGISSDYHYTWNNKWTYRPYSLAEGKYTATVTAVPSDAYFKNSPTATSDPIAYAPLFGNGTPSAWINNEITGTGATANTLTGFTAGIDLSGIAKPGVTYSLERVKLDAVGNEEAAGYQAVTLYKSSTGTTTWATGDWTADALGNLPVTGGYDRILSPAAGTYRYRVKAVKAGIDAQYKSFEVEADPYEYLTILSVSIGDKETEGTNFKYAVTPSVFLKGVLQEGDKVVIYAVKGVAGSYQSGPYAKAVEFTKAQLEAGTAQDLVLANDGDAAFVQAYLELADGTKEPISRYSIEGVIIASYSVNYNDIYYGILDY